MAIAESNHMAAKKKITKKRVVRQGDKTTFVRSLPRSMPATEVQAKAKAEGLVMTTAYIHNIRSATGKKAREMLKGKKKLVKGNKKSQEKMFSELVVSLGPARCKKLLEQTEAALIAST